MASEWLNWAASRSSFLLLDGGIGLTLMQRGHNLDVGSMWSGRLLVTNPTEITALATDWLSAGSDIICSATYQVTLPLIQAEFDYDETRAQRVVHNSWKLLDEARSQFWARLSETERETRRFPKVALSLGPYSAVSADGNEYTGLYNNEVSREQLREFHEQRTSLFVKLCKDPNASFPDVVFFETIGNLDETIAIAEVMSTPNLRDVPFMISFQCRNEREIASGELLETTVDHFLKKHTSNNIISMGVNCFDVNLTSALVGIIQQGIRQNERVGREQKDVQIAAYPNSGETWTEDGWIWKDGNKISLSSWASLVQSSNAQLVGGCCRAGPDHIQALHALRKK